MESEEGSDSRPVWARRDEGKLGRISSASQCELQMLGAILGFRNCYLEDSQPLRRPRGLGGTDIISGSWRDLVTSLASVHDN